MAFVVPGIEELNLLPQPLTSVEEALMKVLMVALDDTWTIFVQPHLNGVKPDLVVYKENCGLGIFEVKDWNLEYYRTKEDEKWYKWEQFNPVENQWGLCSYECPMEQVKRYRDTIFNYEIPILSAHNSIDKRVYTYVNMFVFFHGQSTDVIEDKLAAVFQHQKYVNGFGDDCLDPARLKRYLQNHHLTRDFPQDLMDCLRAEDIDRKIRDALAYQRSPIDDRYLKVKLSAKQRDLLLSEPKARRVVASAGSGKTLILVHKAVNAAREGKKALIVCFNITMVNYLRDMVVGLANQYQLDTHQYIYVRHYHRIYPPERDPNFEDLPDNVDILLIDEGQDFERDWITNLINKFKPSHWMIVEDLRQNIYEKDYHQRRSIPGIQGRPNQLRESYRLPDQISQLANALIRWEKIQEDPEESGDVETGSTQLSLLAPSWADGTLEEALSSIEQMLVKIIREGRKEQLEDMVILVCEIKDDGWPILELLERLKLPYQSNFESQVLYNALVFNCEKEGRNVDFALQQYRRGLKANFYGRSGRIKVCTIHSFKGWEVGQVIVIFRPRISDSDQSTSLLYTAITRSMNQLIIYNAEKKFNEFGKAAAEQGLVNQSFIPVDIQQLTVGKE